MDNLPNQTPPFNTNSPAVNNLSVNSIKILALVVVIFFLSSLTGFIISKTLLTEKPSSRIYSLPTNTENLPVKLDLLQNTMMTNWSGGIDGKVIDKTEDSFTISPILKQYNPDGTREFKEASSSSNMKIIYINGKTVLKTSSPSATLNFSDLIINSIISGTVEIYTKSSPPAIIGRTISILK